MPGLLKLALLGTLAVLAWVAYSKVSEPRYWRVGDTGVVSSAPLESLACTLCGKGLLPLSAWRFEAGDAKKFFEARDPQGLDQAFMRSRLLESGSHVRLLSMLVGIAEVRVLDGNLQGSSGFLPLAWVFSEASGS